MSELRGDYTAGLILDQDGPLTADQLAWLDKVQGVRAIPGSVASELRALADFCDIAQRRPDAIQTSGALRWVREELRALAEEVSA
ncbi:MAG: hypothetical protein ACYDHY_17535 [Acidiferrobacterales bacterium]